MPLFFSSRTRLILAALILLPTHFAWGQDDFPLPERFVQRGDNAGYTHAAQDFLKAHPDSEFAPRVALDLLMLSNFNGEKTVADEMEEKLLLDYLESMQGAYFGSTYAKAEDYRARLTKLSDQYIQNPSDGFPQKYRRALTFGSQKFGNDLFNDKDFLLKSALVVATTGDTELQRTLLDNFKGLAKKDGDTKLQAIAALATDETKPLPERILGLHQDSENTRAGLLRDLLLLRLSKDEKDTPALRQVNAESLLEQRRFQAALPILEQLPTDKDGDKILFQRLWCHAVAGEVKRVAELQARLDKEFPLSPWRERGLQLSRAAENAAKNIGLYAEALRTVVGTAKKDFDSLEATLSYEKKGTGKKYTAYLGLSFGLKYVEAQLSEGKDLLLAYQSTATDSMVFINSEPTIRRYRQTALMPTANFNIVRGLDGILNLQAGVGVYQFGKTNQSSLDSPYLNDPKKIKATIQGTLNRGALLGNVSESPAGKTFSLLRPNGLKPEIEEIRIVVTGDNRIAALQPGIGTVGLHDIHYGPMNSVKFAPPPWPNLPFVTEEKVNVSYLLKLASKIVEMFAPAK